MVQWQTLAADEKEPTQYYLSVVDGVLIATSKDHVYRWDEPSESWVQVGWPDTQSGEAK